jgi:endonuclease VIII
MPEGHKTHYFAKRHTHLLGGTRLGISSPQGRFAEGAKTVNNQTLDHVTAAGKHLFYWFRSHSIIHVHLGRYGSFREHVGTPEPRGLVRLRMSHGETTVDLSGPTQCRVLDAEQVRRIIESLGPDPLGEGKWEDAWTKIKASKKPIGALILDQAVIAGVGNIFRAEALFELQINPLTPGLELSKKGFQQLWKSLLKMMRTGLKHGKIITVSVKEAGKPLAKLTSKERLRIYRQDECPRCGGPIGVVVVAARDLYVCPHCQNVPRNRLKIIV